MNAKTKNIKHEKVVVDIEQYIDPEHLYSVWYGGSVASIRYRGYNLDILANGDISLYGNIDGEEFSHKDKSNGGSVYDVLGKKITDKELMFYLKNPFYSPENHLEFDNSNWFELFIAAQDGQEYSESYVLNADTLPEAIAEVLTDADDYIQAVEETENEKGCSDNEYVIDRIDISDFNMEVTVKIKNNKILYSGTSLNSGESLTAILKYNLFSDAVKFVVSKLRILPSIIKNGGDPKTEVTIHLNKNLKIYRDGNAIKSNGDFTLPENISVFDSPEQACAFLKGVLWVLDYKKENYHLSANEKEIMEETENDEH